MPGKEDNGIEPYWGISQIKIRHLKMKISASYAIVLSGNVPQERIEWGLIHQNGAQVDPFFILGVQALIEGVVHSENRIREELRYNTVCRISIEKIQNNSPGWVRVTLRRQSSLIEIQETLSKALSLWLRQGTPLGEEKIITPVFLTFQEIRVAQYLREGFSQTQTGIIMGLSVKTINAHKQSLMRKIGFKNNREFQYWLLAESGGLWGEVLNISS
ncbi:helix-turn-helix transcriptional regulator [Serratia marcescens]|uniref:helix-turn-helix transcriptional regulator n=1 Tax=Serratia marcescens TaxID=615 RepID=UPI003FA69A2D